MSYDGSLHLGNRTTVGNFDATVGLTVVGRALDNAYVAGVSGKCDFARFSLPRAAQVATVYYATTLVTGAPTSVDIELRSGTRYAPNMAAGGLLASKADNPGGVAGWRAVPNWSLAVSANTILWVVVADKDGAGGNFITHAVGSGIPAQTLDQAQWEDVITLTSNDGGQTLLESARPPLIVLLFSDSRTIGNPFLSSLAAADSRRRGVRFTLPWAMAPFASYANGDGMLTGMEVWQGNDGPAGSPLLSSSWVLPNFDGTQTLGVLFPPNFHFQAGVSYRCVWTFSGGTASLGRYQIGAGADATLRTLLPLGGNYFYTEDNAGVWSDEPDSYPHIGLCFKSLP